MQNQEPCKPIPFALTLINLEGGEQADKDQIANLIQAIDKTEIRTYCDNDGIGAFECWGKTGFDKGTDYLVIDEADSIALTLSITTGFDETNEDDVIEYLQDKIGDKAERKVTQGGGEYHDGISADFELEIQDAKIENNIFTCSLVWD
jgi:hypothetical protein